MTEDVPSVMDSLCRDILAYCGKVGWYGSDMEREWATPEQHERWSQAFANQVASEEELQAAEAALGFSVPATYAAMLRNVANGRFGPGTGFVPVASERLVDPNPISTHGYHLAEVYQRLRTYDWPEHWLAIADLGCGNLLLLNADDERVARYDDSGAFDSSFISEDASLEEYLRIWMAGEDMEMREVSFTCALTGKPVH